MPSAADIVKKAMANGKRTTEPQPTQTQTEASIPPTRTHSQSPPNARYRTPASPTAHVRAPVAIPQAGKREPRANTPSAYSDIAQPPTAALPTQDPKRQALPGQSRHQPEPERRSPPELPPQSNPAFVPPPTRSPEIYKALMARHDRANQRHLKP